MGKPASVKGGDRAPIALAMWISKEQELELGLEKERQSYQSYRGGFTGTSMRRRQGGQGGQRDLGGKGGEDFESLIQRIGRESLIHLHGIQKPL